MKPRLHALAALASALIPSVVSAQTPWPDLTDASSYSFAANRLSFPNGVLTATSAQRAGLGHLYQVSPPYAVSSLRLLFANFYLDPSGAANPERCPGNPKTVDFATVFVGATAYPVTFGGATSTRIGDCEFIWSDPLRDASGALVTLPAGTLYYIRSSQSVAVGEKLTFSATYGINSRISNATLGDGVEYTGNVQTAKRTSGTVAAFLNGSAPIGPSMAIGTGWNGSPVFLVVGDSIGAGQSDADYQTAARGLVGYLPRALDDSGFSTRLNFANLAAPGTRPGDQASIGQGQFQLRMRALRSVPNRPFNRVFSEMGQNGLNANLPQWQAEMKDWWQFWRLACPNCPIYQTTYLPHAGQSNNQFWADQASQVSTGTIDGYPSGARWQAINWLKAGADIPGYVTVLDVTPAFQDPANPQNWKSLPGSWTLSAAIPAATGTLTVAGGVAPASGDWYVFEPGTANAETRQVSRVTGTGPWTLTLIANTAKPHGAGTSVLAAATGDGTHPGSTPHKAAASMLIGRKADGTIR